MSKRDRIRRRIMIEAIVARQNYITVLHDRATCMKLLHLMLIPARHDEAMH